MTDSLEYTGPVYGRAPRALLRDPNISPQAKALWTLLEDHASPESPVPFPGQRRLAEFMGVSDRTIRNWLDELAGSGWLTRRQTGRSCRYQLTWKNRSDRKQASGRDRKQASGQIGTRLPTKKNQEEEPIEEPSPQVSRSTQEGTQEREKEGEGTGADAVAAALPDATENERALIIRAIAQQGTIKSLRSFARSETGQRDLENRLDKLRAERRANPEHGMSPPVGKQWYECPWPEPETMETGLAQARAALRRELPHQQAQ